MPGWIKMPLLDLLCFTTLNVRVPVLAIHAKGYSVDCHQLSCRAAQYRWNILDRAVKHEANATRWERFSLKIITLAKRNVDDLMNTRMGIAQNNGYDWWLCSEDEIKGSIKWWAVMPFFQQLMAFWYDLYELRLNDTYYCQSDSLGTYNSLFLYKIQ